jgi:3-hydroxybutyryl-CoA dehydratase
MSAKLNTAELCSGTSLPGFRKQITQEEINLYAAASRDFNPIHIDPEFARQTAAGGTIAHGMLVLAYISQMMTDAFGKSWLTGGKFNVRFKTPARPKDELEIQGNIKKMQNESAQTAVYCEVLCSNQKGETVITGEAIVRIKNNENLD